MNDDTPQGDLVTAAVTAVSLPENFSIPAAAALARDMAISLYDRPVTLKKHGVSEEQYATLEAHPYFKKLLELASIEWNGPKSIQDRLALEAAVGIEQAMPDIIARLSNKHEDFAAVVQGLKVLGEIAGVGHNKGPTAPTERFSIHIDLGAGAVEVYEKKRPGPVEAPIIDIEPILAGQAVQSLPAGLGALLALSPKPETP